MKKPYQFNAVLIALFVVLMAPTVVLADGDSELPQIELWHTMKHVAAKAATCTAAGNIEYYYCTGCKKYFSDAEGNHEIAQASTTIAATGHAVATVWTSDDASHWHACKRCEEKLDTAAHTWDNSTVITEPTCTAAGVKAFTCSVCGKTKTESVASFGHAASTAWTYDDTHHWHACTHCGERLETAAHTWDAGAVTAKPTCTATGVKTFTCSVCGKTETELIAARGHDWKAATYEWNDGYTKVTARRVCANDASHVETEIADVDAAKTVTIAATDTEPGSITYTSKGFTNTAFKAQTATVVIPMLGHSWNYEHIIWAWTGDDAEGWTAATATVPCTTCDKVLVFDATISVFTTDPTCAKVGKVTYTATVNIEGREEGCTDVKEVAIPALGHSAAGGIVENVAAPTCTAAGGYDTVTYCSACGDELGREHVTVAAPGHSWDSGEVTTEPTETTKGVRTYTCQVCGATRTEEFEATGLWLRLWGNSRLDTMAAIVSEGKRTGAWSPGVAVIAASSSFPDALVASSVAGAIHAPVVLTGSKSLSSQASRQLSDLDVSQVYVMGGTSAVSDGVTGALDSMGIKWERIAGDNRQATSLDVLRWLRERGAVNTVVVATGQKFADALAIGPWCAAKAVPILLTGGKSTELNEAQFAALTGVKTAYIVGGELAVSKTTETRLKNMGISVERLAGGNRYSTAKEIANFELANGMTLARAAVATGDNYPDALAGAALCGANNSVMILAKNSASPAISVIEDNPAGVSLGYVLGGSVAVSDSLFSYLHSLTV